MLPPPDPLPPNPNNGQSPEDQDDSLADNIDLYLDELQRLPYPTEAITALNVPWEERPSYIMGFFRDKCSQDHITSKCSFSVEQLPELLEEHHNPDLPRFIKVLLVDTANLTPACVEILGIYLNIPPVFFAAHVATGGTEADPESDTPQMCLLKHQWRELPGGARWISYEWRRPATLNPEFEGEFGCGDWTSRRYASAESCLPYRTYMVKKKKEEEEAKLNSPVRLQENKVQGWPIGRVVRPCWTTGMTNRVMYLERVSVFESIRSMLALILVDSAPLLKVQTQSGKLYSSSDKWELARGSHGMIYPPTSDICASHCLQEWLFKSSDPFYGHWDDRSQLDAVLVRQAVNFYSKSLQEISRSLDMIDRFVCNDDKVRREVAHWRYLFGVWRSVLPSVKAELRQILDRLYSPTDDWAQDILETALNELEKARELCDTLQQRNDRTFTAVMSTMSIMESQQGMKHSEQAMEHTKQGIKQAHEVQKLTELAFVFIPLGFVASFFGMEVADFDTKKPTVKLFWGIGISVVGGLYVLRIIMYSVWYRKVKRSVVQYFKRAIGKYFGDIEDRDEKDTVEREFGQV